MIGIIHSKLYKYLLVILLLSFTSGMIFTNELNLYFIIACLIIFINILLLSFSPTLCRNVSLKSIDILFLLFLILIIFTAFYRGWGFEFLGSEKSGGMTYIKFIVLILLYLTTINISLTEKEKIFLIKVLLFGSCLPFISDIFKLVFGFENIFSKLIPGSITLENFLESSNNESGVIFRIQSCAPLSIALHIYFICFHSYLNNKNKFILSRKVFLFILLELILITLSGHRLALIENLLIFIFVYYFIGKNKINIKRALKILVTIIIVLVGIILSYNYLPVGLQRLFSFLPFLQENIALADATASSNFRLILLANAIKILPDYFWIGKGFAFINYHVDQGNYFELIERFTEYGAFHFGEVGLLINLGFFGFLIGNAILLKSFKYIFKLTTSIQVVNVFKIILLLVIFEFIFIYGDVQTNFQAFIFYMFFLKILIGLKKN